MNGDFGLRIAINSKGLIMPKKSPNTTNSQIKSALHRLFLRSRERGRRIKDDKYTCQRCGLKQSKAKGREVKVEVHHINGVKWADIIQYIRDQLLVDPDKLETLCLKCHKDEHRED
jgi:hypothetical protein